MPKHPLGGMRWDAEVTGSKATMSCANYGVPHNGNFIIVQDADGRTVVVKCFGKTIYPVALFSNKHSLVMCIARRTGNELLNETVDSGGYSTYDLMVLAFCSHVRQVEAGWVTDTQAFENTGCVLV